MTILHRLAALLASPFVIALYLLPVLVLIGKDRTDVLDRLYTWGGLL